MYLILAHPTHAKLDCKFCWKYMHNEEFTPQYRGGELIERYGGFLPPCMVPTSKGCPKGKPDGMSDLTQRNWRIYRHYLECKATGTFPDDPAVRNCARLIREAEDAADRKLRADMAAAGAGRV